MKSYHVTGTVTFEVELLIDAKDRESAMRIAESSFNEINKIQGKPEKKEITSIKEILTP